MTAYSEPPTWIGTLGLSIAAVFAACGLAGAAFWWPAVAGGVALLILAGGAAWWAGRRAQADELAELRTYADAARSSAFALDAAEVGSTTGQVNAERAMTLATADVWHRNVGFNNLPPTEQAVVRDFAIELLNSLYLLRCQVVTPDTRDPVPRADEDPERMVDHLWPREGGS
jgi:hypothetical protein